MTRFLRQAGRFIFAVLLAIDLLGSALTGGGAYETLSARLGRGRARGLHFAVFGANFVDWTAQVFFGQAHHCEGALAAYETRMAVSGEVS